MGWACDNVANYEVVLSNGSVVNANSTSNPDLYFALRGGGNNFGVVTRFDLETFPHGDMWGGQVYHPIETNRSQFEAYHWFAENLNSNPNGALTVTAVAAPEYGVLFVNNYEYARPLENPPIFDNFTSITNFSSTMRITRLPDLAKELKDAQGYGFRQMYITATFKNNVQMMSDIFDMWHAAVDPVFTDVAGLVAALVFQPVTPRVIEKFGKNGGNALGINPDDGSLTICLMLFQWSNQNNDTFIINTLENIVSRANTIAKSRGLYHRYVYQNYAYISQDVFAGYGPENKARLLEIQQAYDPEKVFVDLQPGYFKLRE